MCRIPNLSSIDTIRSMSCNPATVQPTAFTILPNNLRRAGESQTSSSASSASHSKYLWRTSGGKRAMASGASVKVCRYSISPTACAPCACTCSQLCSTADLPWSDNTPRPETPDALSVAPPRGTCGRGGALNWCRPTGGAGASAMSSCPAPSSSNSRSRRLSFNAWPRATPSSFKSKSSASSSVSISSKPLLSNTRAYCEKPKSARNATTGCPASSSCSPSAPRRWSSWSFLRNRTTWYDGMPKSFISASSMAAKVSKSSKPLCSKDAAYICKPASRKKATTALFWSTGTFPLSSFRGAAGLRGATPGARAGTAATPPPRRGRGNKVGGPGRTDAPAGPDGSLDATAVGETLHGATKVRGRSAVGALMLVIGINAGLPGIICSRA
mmetsp:Transcript_56623/g.172382  ORF Transcript_56623/g.172382 Transcript_56623/m.172382 type:complete len:385 (+) Transcript_56623:695-1849(+)